MNYSVFQFFNRFVWARSMYIMYPINDMVIIAWMKISTRFIWEIKLFKKGSHVKFTIMLKVFNPWTEILRSFAESIRLFCVTYTIFRFCPLNANDRTVWSLLYKKIVCFQIKYRYFFANDLLLFAIEYNTNRIIRSSYLSHL